MNPNLKYAEMFRGKNNGSAGGIMAGVNLPEVIDAVGLNPELTNLDETESTRHGIVV